MSFCSQCGHRLNEDSRFCGSCGAPVAAATAPESPGAPADREPLSTAPRQASRSPQEVPTPQREATPPPAQPARRTAPLPGASSRGPSAGSSPKPSAIPMSNERDPHPTEPAATPRKRSRLPLLAGLAAVIVALGAGGGYWLTRDHDHSTSAPHASVAPSAARSSDTPAAKPASMPNLTGKTLSEAQALLSSKVTLVPTSNLVENMDGAEKITKQDAAPGSKTPDTVKVNVDEPANVSYIDQSNDLVVDNENPFNSTDNVSVAGTQLSHAMTASMYGGDGQQPDTLQLNLNKSYQRFRSVVGVTSDSQDSSKRFTVTIQADGHQLWKQDVGFKDAPKNIDLDVSGALRLSIQVTVDGGDSSQSSSIAFGSMRLLAEPGSAQPSPTSN